MAWKDHKQSESIPWMISLSIACLQQEMQGEEVDEISVASYVFYRHIDNILKDQSDDETKNEETVMRIKNEFIEKCHNMTPKNNYITRVLSGLYYMQFHDSLEEWSVYVSKCISNGENFNDSKEYETFIKDLLS